MLTPIIQSSRFEFERRAIVKKTTVFFTHAREAILPADFLNAEQRASYGQFSGEPNDVQLARFFLLDEADMEFISNWGYPIQVSWPIIPEEKPHCVNIRP